MLNLIEVLQTNGTGFLTGHCRSTNSNKGLMDAVEDVLFPKNQEDGNELEGVPLILKLVFSNETKNLGVLNLVINEVFHKDEILESIEGVILIPSEKHQYVRVNITLNGNHPIGNFNAILLY